jgi:hypothetical protein
MKSSNEGITSQKISDESAEIFCMSFVSTYNQMNASIDNKGIEARMLPAIELRFEISEIRTITTADITTLRI